MSTPANPVPDGFHTVTPYLIITGAAQAIEFYRQAFNAVETFRMPMPGGKIGHAEIRIDDSPVMLGDECPEMNIKSPTTLGGTATGICLYVADADAAFARATAAGAKVIRPLQDQFYGDRSGTVLDPFGHLWTLSTRKENLTPEEIGRRAAEFAKQSAPGPQAAQ